jgi:uncharacterized protein (DUF849 family)
MVALNGARNTRVGLSALPMTLDEIVAEAFDCHAAGADVLQAVVVGFRTNI